MSRVPVYVGSGYCRVIVRIREKTHQSVMNLLSASGRGDDLSALVEDLLGQWLASNEGEQRAAGKRPSKQGEAS
jgi:hypothetical protein